MVEISVIFTLLLLNGMFAMAEIALVSARRSRLKLLADDGKSGAKTALRLAEKPERFLSTVQVGITLVAVFSGAYGGATLTPYVTPWIAALPALAPHAESVSLGLVVVAVTYCSIVVGELVPKSLALRSPEAIASATARPMELLSIIARPIVWTLEQSTRLMLFLFGRRPEPGGDDSVEEVEVILREGITTGAVHQEESEMVEGVFDLREVLAEEVMQPRPQIIFLPHDATPEDYWAQVSATSQTVFPVYEENRDSVVAMVSLRMLFANLASPERRTLGEIGIEPLFVSETETALSLLGSLRHSTLGAALVTDEFGTVRGLVTLEDLVEEVVGDLRPGDLERDRPTIRQTSPASWIADGLVEIDEVERSIPNFASLTEQEKEPFQTLAGYIIHFIDRLPVEGESFTAGNLEFEIVDMDRQRIDKVAIRHQLPAHEDTAKPEEPSPTGEEPATGEDQRLL